MATLRPCKSMTSHDSLTGQRVLDESTNQQASAKNKRRSYTKEDLLGINMKLKENQIFPIETQIFTNSEIINNEINTIKKNKNNSATVSQSTPTQPLVPCIGKGSIASSLVSCISTLIHQRDDSDPTRPLLLSDILSMNNLANISIDESTGQKVLCTTNAPKNLGISSSMKDLHKLDINHNDETISDSDKSSMVTSTSMQDLTKLHREKKKKKKVFRNSGESFEIDDKSSDHSKKTKKKSRKSKHYCDIHGYKNRHTNEDIDNNNDESALLISVMITSNDSTKTDSTTSDLVCTCRPKKVKEENEGLTFKTHRECMNEYDSIIFNNEPLFSDLDDDPIQEEQVKSEMERYHKRTNQPDMFAAAQLINTNTTLKFAIITNELKNVNCSLKRVNSYLHAVSHMVYGVSES